MPFALVGGLAGISEESDKNIAEVTNDTDFRSRPPSGRNSRQPAPTTVRRLDLALVHSHSSNELNPALHTTSRLRRSQTDDGSILLVDYDQSLFSAKVQNTRINSIVLSPPCEHVHRSQDGLKQPNHALTYPRTSDPLAAC